MENRQLNNKTIEVLWDRAMQIDKIIWENAEPWTWQFTVLALKGKDKRQACVGLFEQMELSFKQTPGEGRKKKKATNHHNIWGLKPLHNTVKSRSKVKKRESGRKTCNREEQLGSLLRDWCLPWSNDSTARTQLWNSNPHPRTILRILSWF